MTTAPFEPQPATTLTAAATPAASPTVSSPISADQAVEAVALHVAATALSASATLAERERVRSTWAAHLVVADACRHPKWHVLYLPGMTFNDGETWAVHRTTGRVAGGECDLTGQRDGESTDAWLNRLG